MFGKLLTHRKAFVQGRLRPARLGVRSFFMIHRKNMIIMRIMHKDTSRLDAETEK